LHAQLLAPAGARFARDLDRLGKMLGEDHDLAVLLERLESHKSAWASEQRAAQSKRARLGPAALKLAVRIFAARPRDFARRLVP